jgi:hypothetical protein
MRRPWRGATLEITIERDPALTPCQVVVELDGRPLEGNFLAPLPEGSEVRIRVLCGQRWR